MLIGNKYDMQNNRIISTEQGEEIAQRYKVPFLETSAKDNFNIDEAFNRMTKLLLEKVRSPFIDYFCYNFLLILFFFFFIARKISKYFDTRI